MQLPFWRNYWQKPENIDIRHNIMPTGKRGLYISVNKEKKCPFYWKAKGCHHKKIECAGRKAREDEEKEGMNRLYWHKGVIWGEIPSENYRMFVVKRTISKENSSKIVQSFICCRLIFWKKGICLMVMAR